MNLRPLESRPLASVRLRASARPFVSRPGEDLSARP